MVLLPYWRLTNIREPKQLNQHVFFTSTRRVADLHQLTCLPHSLRLSSYPQRLRHLLHWVQLAPFI